MFVNNSYVLNIHEIYFFHLIIFCAVGGQTKIFLGNKKFWGAQMFDFRQVTVFCLGHYISKHKTTGYAKTFLGEWLPGCAYDFVLVTLNGFPMSV